MVRIRVVIVGAGQAGLAVSRLLTGLGVDHVVLERGRTGERWISQRWDSLRLLTPNWMSRLPGWSYRGSDPAGYMPAGEVAQYLAGYAADFAAPVVHGAAVRSIERHHDRFRVRSDAGCWTSDAVVIATGFCDRPSVPGLAAALDPSIAQITPDRYRSPRDVPAGRVLVVGASATGAQLADELAGTGRDVVLAVGRHTRLPRRYRGLDIMWWLDSMGLFDRAFTGDRAPRAEPSLQVVGSLDHRDVDLRSLAGRGVTLVGRVTGADRGRPEVAGDLAATAIRADARLDRLLARIDRHARISGLDGEIEPAVRPRPFAPGASRSGQATIGRLDGIRSVIWATGYRRDYSWLRVPVFDAAGEIAHTAGRTAVDRLFVIGLRDQTRRSSTFLDGVRHDAELVVDHLLRPARSRPFILRRAS
jgi:putative flavoprotein involved in K+ transport